MSLLSWTAFDLDVSVSLINKRVQVFVCTAPPRRLGLNFSALFFTNLLVSVLNKLLLGLLGHVETY